MNHLPLLRSRRGPRKTWTTPSFISSSASLRKRPSRSPYLLVVLFLFLGSAVYLLVAYTWLFSTSPSVPTTNLPPDSLPNRPPLLPHVQFDAHNFLHDKALDESQPSMVHIVHTRFMQHQPSLLHLAQARLHLFETFCLPTMIHQTSNQFLWFILVDPELDTSILSSLLQLVQPYPHFFVIATLVNYWIGPDKNGSWRNGIEGTEIWSHVYQDQVYTGNLDLIVSAMHMEEDGMGRKPILLETRLDSDDGLHTRFIESIQHDALHMFHSTNQARWLYWCSKKDIVWFPQQVHPYPNMEEGEVDTWGSVELRHMTHECISAGLTVGMNTYTSYEQVPQYDHNQLYHRITFDAQDCGLSTSQECVRLLGSQADFYIPVVRARTLTSAGMKDVTPQALELVESQTDLFSILYSSAFFITADKVKQSREYIQSNWVDIAKENLLGQCRGKHRYVRSVASSTVSSEDILLVWFLWDTHGKM